MHEEQKNTHKQTIRVAQWNTRRPQTWITDKTSCQNIGTEVFIANEARREFQIDGYKASILKQQKEETKRKTVAYLFIK